MNNDLFGGLMKGLSSFMPQDDPNVKLMNSQNEVNDLKTQESEVFTEIGKLAFDQNPEAFPTQANKLRLIQANLMEAEAKLKSQTQANQAAQQAARDTESQLCCTNCGYQNPDGVRFCQECGSKLGAGKVVCQGCGYENPSGTRFCGGCGQKTGE